MHPDDRVYHIHHLHLAAIVDDLEVDDGVETDHGCHVDACNSGKDILQFLNVETREVGGSLNEAEH